MKLDYIYHSGFAIEADGVTVIIDYYKDTSEEAPNRGIVHDCLLKKPGMLYVLSSHFHPDHFNREVLSWKEERPAIRYIFSKDILNHRIDLQGIRLFHAGDLNNWHWSEESTPQEILKAEGDFLAEIKILQQKAPLVDVAMFPVDSRIGKDYMRGAEQFVERIKTTIFAPMHFSEDYRGGNSFHTFAESKGCRFLTISRRGESFDITK